ncbi:MAG: hypothetical protein HC830_07240 [Bacteroidetes bacterium]|nr:hypothetical protein [Bacteroidota bacterium]
MSSSNRSFTGYYQARTFYVPRYDVPDTGPKKPDLRTTLFWEPNIQTDVEGNARCSFYNAEGAGTVEIRVEGMAKDGIPLTGIGAYTVE